MALRYGTERYGTGRYSAGTSAQGVAVRADVVSGGLAMLRGKTQYAARASHTSGGRAAPAVTKHTTARSALLSGGKAGLDSFKRVVANTRLSSDGYAVTSITRPVAGRASQTSDGYVVPKTTKRLAARPTRQETIYESNLIENGDFVEGIDGWYPRREATLSHTGTALRVTSEAGYNWIGARYDFGGLIPGETYRIQVSIVETNSSNAGFGIPDKLNHYGLSPGQHEVEFVATTETEIIQLGFEGFSGAGSYIEFDRIRFQRKVEGAQISARSGGHAGVTLNVEYVMGRIDVQSTGRANPHYVLGAGAAAQGDSTGRAATTTTRRVSGQISARSRGRAGVEYTTHLAGLSENTTESSARARRRRRFAGRAELVSQGRAAANVSRTAGLRDSGNQSGGQAGVKRIRGVRGHVDAVSGVDALPHYTLGAGATSDSSSTGRALMKVSYASAGRTQATSGGRAKLTNLWRVQRDPANPWTLVGHPHDELRGNN